MSRGKGCARAVQKHDRAGAVPTRHARLNSMLFAFMTRSRRVAPWGWGAEIYETPLQDRVERQRDFYPRTLRRGMDRIGAKAR